MAKDSDGMFKIANNKKDGNLSFLEREGYQHDQKACDEYTYNGLRFFGVQSNPREKREMTCSHGL